jgi:hypothetical protein
MSLSTTSKVNVTLKKLNGKAHTSNDKGLINESLSSGITTSYTTIFGEQIPAEPNQSTYYDNVGGKVEYVRLVAEFIQGTDTSSGQHSFSLSLPSDYESNSTNTKVGTYPFLNSQKLHLTKGKLQLVSTSFGGDYEAKPYYNDGAVTLIPVTDQRNWTLDYFNGILFQQDPPGTGAHAQNPVYVDALLYIGNMLDDVISSSAGGGSGTSSSGTTTLREKNIYSVSSTISAATNIIVPGVDFNLASQDPELIDIHLNGMLIAHSGELGLGISDYDIIDYQTIQMNFVLEADDLVTIAVFNKTAITSMSYNEIPSGAIDGSNMIFTLANTPISGATISFNGQILTPKVGSSNKDYILTTDTITLTTAYTPTGEDVLLATYSY